LRLVLVAAAALAALAPAAAGERAVAPPANGCPAPSDAYLRARLSGAVDRSLDWHAGGMECEGMQRPDGHGLRLAFRGRAGREGLTFVFGVPRLEEGESRRAVPVNLTVIREGRGLYGTRGDDKCTLDEVRQTALGQDARGRRWRVEARGFCLEPARAVGGEANDAILVATFDFAGVVTWELDPGPGAPALPPLRATPKLPTLVPPRAP
jgi:hypothetical protein